MYIPCKTYKIESRWIFSPSARAVFGYFGVTWHVTVLRFFLPSLLCQKRIFLSNKTVSRQKSLRGQHYKILWRHTSRCTVDGSRKFTFVICTRKSYFPRFSIVIFGKQKMKINGVQSVQRAHVILKRTARFFFLFFLSFCVELSPFKVLPW